MSAQTVKIEDEVSSAIVDMPAVDGVPVLEFTKVEQYTTFSAEFAFDGDDIVFHFYLPPELKAHANTRDIRKYWLETFPTIFEPVVMDVFKAAPPRLQAKYISDMGLDSWWFRAFGFANTLNPEGLCDALCSKLDQSLDTKKLT